MMINYLSLYRRLQKYRVTKDEDMPWAYRKANPNGRPHHNDWGIMSDNPILKFLQPWQRIPRSWSAYRCPLPLRIEGPKEVRAIPWDGKYPLVSRTEVFDKRTEFWDGEKVVPITLPHVNVDFQGYGKTKFYAFLDGEWVHCGNGIKRDFKIPFYKPPFYKIRRWYWYDGLKQDTTMGMLLDGTLTSDWMGHFPELWNNLGEPE